MLHRFFALEGLSCLDLFLVAEGVVLSTQVAESAATYEHRLQEGQKAIFHLEAFVARVMSDYKKWCIDTYG